MKERSCLLLLGCVLAKRVRNLVCVVEIGDRREQGTVEDTVESDITDSKFCLKFIRWVREMIKPEDESSRCFSFSEFLLFWVFKFCTGLVKRLINRIKYYGSIIECYVTIFV